MTAAVDLLPSSGVERRGRAFFALTDEPWLFVEAPALLAAAGAFVEITYRASLWDEPVRPVFRFDLADGTRVDRLAAGPVAGAGIWIGRVPAGTVRASVSPTCRAGLFGFRIEAIRRRSWIELLAMGARRNARSTRSAILTRLIGWGPESDINLAWAIGSTPVADYSAWRHARARPLELDGLDAPRVAWERAAPIHLVIDARRGAAGLAATLQSLQAQLFPHWTACVLGEHPLPAGPRVSALGPAPAQQAGAGIVGRLQAGDRLEPHALACLAEAADRHPACSLFYGDAERDGPSGLLPVFEPGWSPLLARQAGLGSGVFVRRALLETAEEARAFHEEAALPARVFDGSVRAFPLRRVLLRAAASGRSPASASWHAPAASAAIVIPTRDQPTRLRQAVDSIRRVAGAVRPAVVVVDNGSVLPETKHLLEAMRGEGVVVLERPGAFNFSALCNDGAAAAGPVDVLVFLNDDTEVLGADWLDRLAHWALQPATGAVGPKLLYPDGRVQHVGVVVGMGESAGHFGAFAAADAPGWADRHHLVHEVSAVTGACLAVARAKFEAVGGFDAANLPVELSDIDLCLRLGERGWASLVDPAVRLRHDESASRGGATFRRAAVYEGQRAYFQRRWLSRLRDDPYFHPGLSLFNWKAALA